MLEDIPSVPVPGAGEQPILCIGEFRLNLHQKSLHRGAEKIKVSALPFSTLEYLARNRHRVVSKAELLEKVWGGQRDVSAVEQVIRQLRGALGDRAKDGRYIETVPGHGYRLVAEVGAAQEAGGPRPAAAAPAGVRQFRFGRVVFGAAAAFGVCIAIFVLIHYMREPIVARTVINGKILTAMGATGDRLWTQELALPWGEKIRNQDAAWRTQIVDLDGDGAPEVLVAEPISLDEDQLLCFSPRGKLLWRYRSPIQVRFGAWDVKAPWRFDQMLVVPEKPSVSIYLVVMHPIWWPSFLVRISPAGAANVVLASSGNIMALGQLRNKSGSYILAGGINNEYQKAFLAIVRQDGRAVTSPQRKVERYLCTLGCPSARPYRYVLLPRSELNMASDAPYNFAFAIHAGIDGVTVQTQEVDGGLLGAFYYFSPEFRPYSVAYSDSYRKAHRQFEREGRLKHTFEQCSERKTPAILEICDENGNWSTVSVPRAP